MVDRKTLRLIQDGIEEISFMDIQKGDLIMLCEPTGEIVYNDYGNVYLAGSGVSDFLGEGSCCFFNDAAFYLTI